MTLLEISPELIDVGIAVGVLHVPSGSSADSAVPNDDFFAHPDQYLSGVFTRPAQRDAALRIVGSLANPDGPPVTSSGDEQWVALASTAAGSGVTCGLFLVTRPIGDDLLVSLGGQVERTDDVTVRLAARIPLFVVSETGATFAPGTADGDLQIDAVVLLGDHGPLTVEQVTAGVTIPTVDGADPTVVVRLVRPPAGDEGDIVVTSGDPVGPQAARVLTELVTALAAETGAGLGDALGDVLGLLGLDPSSGVPALPLDDIIATGRHAVWRWLRDVFTSTSGAAAWIDRLADLLGVAVGGSGTSAAPWTLCFDNGPVRACVEIATALDAGALVVVPAIRVGARAATSLGVPARADLVARAVRLRLSADPGAEIVPDLLATVTIGATDGTSTLVSTPVPAVGGTVSVGALRTGLAVDGAGPQFLLEAHRVAFPNVTPFPVLDLTDTDAVLDAGGAALTGAVDGVLTALGDSAAARALFALVGLRPPSGTTATNWPHAVALDELFADPLAAVVGFHRQVLAAGRWDRLVDELGALLREVGGAAAAGVVGAGTDGAPWTVAIAGGATGRAELQVWSTTGADGTRLHLGTQLTLPGTTLSTGAELALALAVELVSVCIAGPAGAPAALDPFPVPGLALTIDVGGDLVVDVGPIGILADSACIGVRWDAVTGLQPQVSVDGGRLVLDGTTAPLPMPVWDPDQRRLRFVGDIPWDVLERLVAQLLESLANEAAQLLPSLLGWRSTGGGGVPAIPPPPGTPAVPAAMLGLGDLARDPVRAVGRLLVSLLTGAQGREWANALLGWVTAFTQGLSDSIAVTGIGSTTDPWAVPLVGAGRQVELVVSVGADGGALGGVANRLVPPELQAVTDIDDATEVTIDVLVEAITALAQIDPHVAAAIRRPVDIATSLAALRSALAGTDGLVSSAAQHGLGSAAATLTGVGNLGLPAAFEEVHLPGGAPDGAGRIFVRTAIGGTGAWPGETAARTVHLTAPGLPADSFDLTALPATGPWFVVLPTRLGAGAGDAAAGHAEQAARLRRVVDVLRAARPANSPLALVATGPAGHVARAVAAQAGSGITHLTLLGTSVATAPTAWADGVASGDGLRLLQALRQLTGAEPGVLGEADELLDLLAGVTDGPPVDAGTTLAATSPYPTADVAPPAGLAALPAAVAATTVAGSVDEATLDLALGRLFATLLTARLGPPPTADELRVGVRANPAPLTSNGVRVELAAALDLVTLPLDFGDDAQPQPDAAQQHARLTVRLRLDRPGGWLAGGPTGIVAAARDPRLRAADVDVSVDLVDGAARCGVVLHDAAVFGLSRTRWTIDLSDDPASELPAHLTQEDRVLLGELAAALGPRPSTGALAGLIDALVALGLGTLQADGRLAFEVDPVERLLLDARSVLPRLLADGRAAVAAGLAAATGGSAVGAVATLPLGPAASVALDLTGPLGVTVSVAGSTLAGGASLGGSATVTSAGRVAVAAEIRIGEGTGPNGRFGLDVTVDTAAAVPVAAALTRVGGADGLPRSVALLPAPEVEALGRLGAAALPAEVTRLVLELAIRELPALAALCDAVGLRDPAAGRVRVPTGLMVDPASWLLSTATLGASDGRPDPARVASLVAALRALVPGPHPADGLALPWGLVLRTADVAGTLRVTVGLPAPMQLGSLRMSGSAGLDLQPSGAVAPAFGVVLDLTDPTAPATVLGGIDVALGATASAAARVPIGGTTLTVPVLPLSGGLAGLAGAATRALPIALDALTEVGTFGGLDVGAAVAALGDALDLRVAGHFDLAQLELLLAAGLTSRLADPANRSDLATALRVLLDPLVPGTVGGTGAVVELDLGAHLGVDVDLTAAVPTICVEATGVRPIDELAVSGELCLGAGGVRTLRVGVEVVDPDFLRVGGVALLPGLTFTTGVDTPFPAGAIELALWTASIDAVNREAVVVRVDLATGVAIRWRTGGAAPLDIDDAVAAAFGLARAYLVPLAAGLALGVDEVRDVLERNLLTTGRRVGQLLHPHVLERTSSAGSVRYRLALFDAAPDGSFDLGALLRRVGLTAAEVATALLGAGGGALPLGDLPLAVRIASLTAGGESRFGVALDIPVGEQFVLFDSGDVRLSLEVVDEWLADPGIAPPTVGGRGLELYVLSIPAAGDPGLVPRIVLRGLGLRIDRPDGEKLLDLGVTLRSIGVHGYLDKDVTTPDVRVGGHLELDQFGLPLGAAAGNPVAANFMAPTSDAGDAEQLAPAFSPSLAVVSKPNGADVDVVVRAGPGDGPWWLPIQRAFGPLYVEQVGLGIERTTGGDPASVSILVDGGASLAGLTVQVDDLEVIIPWATPTDLATWRLDLAGIGVGYEGGGITVAGGLRKLDRNGSADYLGMLRVTFVPYGLTAVGGYGVFPDGAGGEYVSFFGFGAVTAPIGGPPAFFVTGLGGGMGVNRRLIAPTIEQVHTFVLVQALDPFSSMAQDPMGALDQLGVTFPPERGAIWFAAGVSFTSFSLVYGTVLLTVEVHDGLEINLLGLARIALPNPIFPLAQVELALQARMSTQEGVFSVQAQLTENSWLINESCRLTGGFAFVMWFKGELAGQFVVSIGGYHPDFQKPAAFPVVPRVGFAWEPGSGVSIKGGAYFALTATCVMAGGSLEASYKSSIVWASLEVGVHILVSWDPFFYDFKAYARVSAGIDIEVCFFVCGRVRMSFSFSAEVHIKGPKLRGSVKLDLDLTSVTIKFGPSGSTNSADPLSFAAFRDKYLRSGDDGGHVLAAAITAGQVPATATTTGSGSGTGEQGTADDGTAVRPWKVTPEFSFIVQTRAATNAVTGVAVPNHVTDRQLDLGPAHRLDVTSRLVVTVAGTTDVTAAFDRTLVMGKVPEATWTKLPTKIEPGAAVIDSVVGLTLVARVDLAPGSITVEIERIEISKDVKPLPFGAEQRAAAPNRALGSLRDLGVRVTKELSGSTDIFVAMGVLTSGALGDVRLAAASQRADRVAPPRLVALTDGIAERRRTATRTRPVRVRPTRPVEIDTSVGAPRLDAWLRAGASGPVSTPGPTFSVAGSNVERVAAPTLADVDATVGAPLGAWLRLGMQASPGRASATTVLPVGRVPSTSAAGLRRERIRTLRSDRAFGAAATTLDAQLRRAGARVRSGDALVFSLANSRHDRAGRRPSVGVAGVDARVVSLGRSGRVLADAMVVGGGRTVVPQGADRVAVLAGATAPGRSVGWTADATLVQVDDGTYLGDGCAVVASSPPTERRHGHVSTALVRGRQAVAQASSVTTELPATSRTVTVLLEGAAAELPHLTIGGAAAAGPPTVLQIGTRTAMVVEVKRTGDAGVTVTVADQRALAGVIGSAASSDEVVAQLGARGLATFGPLTPVTAGGAGTIRWRDR